MRTTLLVGLSLTVAAVLAVVAGAAFDLDLAPVALLGVTAGAVIGLVPDRTPFTRLAGLLAGVALAWFGYALRALALPDSTGGKAVAVAVVVLACTALTLAVLGRLALWMPLLGAGVFAGAYETAYAAAPPEMATTSVSTVTALLVPLAAGFLIATATVRRDEPGRPLTEEPADLDTPTSEPADAGLSLMEPVR